MTKSLSHIIQVYQVNTHKHKYMAYFHLFHLSKRPGIPFYQMSLLEEERIITLFGKHGIRSIVLGGFTPKEIAVVLEVG